MSQKPTSYSQRKTTGIRGSIMSWAALASTAAMMLLRVSQANKIVRAVLRPNRGVNPKKMPMKEILELF